MKKQNENMMGCLRKQRAQKQFKTKHPCIYQFIRLRSYLKWTIDKMMRRKFLIKQ